MKRIKQWSPISINKIEMPTKLSIIFIEIIMILVAIVPLIFFNIR